MFKSTLQCPQCDKVKLTFETFLTVQLPIPQFKEITYFVKGRSLKEDQLIKGSFRWRESQPEPSLMSLKLQMASVASQHLQRFVHPYMLVITALNSNFKIDFLFDDKCTRLSDFLQMKNMFIVVY